MKHIKPDNMSFVYRNYNLQRQDHLALGMFALFPLANSCLSGLLSEQQFIVETLAAMPEQALDEGWPKPAGEFVLYGAAHAPAGQPVREMQVAARVGDCHKQLIVSGDRHFNALGFPSTPAPFVRMPLTPGQAYGGESVAQNPQGKGAAALTDAHGASSWPLPNVELPGQCLAQRGEQVSPAGFWGVDASHINRSACLGTCDERWLQQRWPHFPEDTQEGYFFQASPDQRLNGQYWQGNEAIELLGLHPDALLIHSHLPGLRARCFVNLRLADGTERFEEYATRAETVWLWPEKGFGVILYRALVPCADEEWSDLLHLLADWESLSSAPLPLEHYQALFQQQIAPPVMPAAAETADAEPLAASQPDQAASTLAETAASALQPELPDFSEVKQLLAQLTQETQAMMKKHGLTEADVQKYMPKPEPEGPAPTLDEVYQLVDKLNAETQSMMEKHGLTEADVQKFMPKPEPESPAPSLKEVKDMLKQLEQETQSMMQKHGLSEKDIESFISSRPELAESWSQIQQARASGACIDDIPDELPELEEPAEPAQASAETGEPDDVGLDQPQLTREDVAARYAAGQSLARFDLTGVDLSGLILTDADFSEAVLENTSFAGCQLSGARFSRALLQGADFSGSQLERADLSGCSAAGSQFVDARLSGANLTQSDFSKASFTRTKLERSNLAQTSFIDAQMDELQAQGVSGEAASFVGASLHAADFTQAQLPKARFDQCKLQAARFDQAGLAGAEFHETDASDASFKRAQMSEARAGEGSLFARADFSHADMTRLHWMGAALPSARLVYTTLTAANLTACQLSGACLYRASALEASLDKADLRDADLTTINLYQGSLRRAKLDGALLHGANLYGANFDGANPSRAGLEGANIDCTLLVVRPAQA